MQWNVWNVLRLVMFRRAEQAFFTHVERNCRQSSAGTSHLLDPSNPPNTKPMPLSSPKTSKRSKPSIERRNSLKNLNNNGINQFLTFLFLFQWVFFKGSRKSSKEEKVDVQATAPKEEINDEREVKMENIPEEESRY